MKVVEMNNNVLQKLRDSGMSEEMKSLEDCEFLVIEEEEERIVGVSGIGGALHVISLIVHDEFRNKGFGKILLEAIIEETKKRKYSFVMASRDSENSNLVKLHNYFSFLPVFQIKYREGFTRDAIFLSFNQKGRIFRKFLTFFNTKIGSAVLIIMIKILKKTLFKIFLTYPSEEFPDPDIGYAIKNFKKFKMNKNSNK